MSSYERGRAPVDAGFAARLRVAIEKSPLSLRDLQDRTGVDKNTLSTWQQSAKTGRPASVSLEKLRLVCAELGVDPWVLLGMPAPSSGSSEHRERLLRELHEELATLEGEAARLSVELAERSREVERLSATLPELRVLAEKALGGE